MLQNVESVTGQELIKSLEECGVSLTEEEKNSILIKAKEQEDKEAAKETNKDNGEGGEENEEELEKACSKMKSEYAEMEKSMADKKKAIEDMEAKMKPVTKSVEEDLSKGNDQNDLIKSLQEEISSFKSINANLEKSLSGISDMFTQKFADMQKSIDEIGNQRMGQRSVKNAQFIEKGGYLQDEVGKKVLSVTSQKEEVLNVLEKAMDKCTDVDFKKSYEQSILHYNMGGAMISKSIADDLFTNHGVRLVQ